MTPIDQPTAEAWLLDTLRKKPTSVPDLTKLAKEHFGYETLAGPEGSEFLKALYGGLSNLARAGLTEGVPSGKTVTGADGKPEVVPGVIRLKFNERGRCVSEVERLRGMDELEAARAFAASVVDPLLKMAEREISAGASSFMRYPDRWWDACLRRCSGGHVSRTVLKSDGLGRHACLECGGFVTLTFPEDKDGPLVIPEG